MAKKKITLEALAAQIAGGFAKQGKEIKDLTESVAFVVTHMATKEDIAKLRAELKADIGDVRKEVISIRRDLDRLTESVSNVIGYRKEIDHALERIAAIEKHLGIIKKIAA